MANGEPAPGVELQLGPAALWRPVCLGQAPHGLNGELPVVVCLGCGRWDSPIGGGSVYARVARSLRRVC